MNSKWKQICLIIILLLSIFGSVLWAQLPQSFEEGAIPSTWSVYNVDGDTKQFVAYNAGTANAHDGLWVAQVGYNLAGNDDWLVTPQLNINASNSLLKFWARSTSTTWYEDFNVKLSTSGNQVENFTVNIASYTQIPNAWTEYSVDLSAYIGQSVYLGIQVVSVNELTFRIDDFQWVMQNDLGITSITGTNTPSVNQSVDYTVNVKNYGSASQSNYTVKLYKNDVEIATQNGTNINSSEVIPYIFNWTPTETGQATLYAKVISDNDTNTSNDQSSNLIVNVQPAGLNVITVGDLNSTTTSNSYPVNFYFKNSLSQCLYMASEINSGGVITSVKYYGNFNNTIPEDRPIKIWMLNTTISSFESTSSWIPTDQFTLVFDGTVDLNVEGNYELTIPLDSPFAYTGGNLVVMAHRPMDTEYYSSLNVWRNTATPDFANRTLYRGSDSAVIDLNAPGTGTRASNVPNTTFFLNSNGFASLSGTVTSQGNPVQNVKVEVIGTNRYTYTNDNGEYIFNFLTPGTVSIKASKIGYYDQTYDNIVLTVDQTSTQDIIINPLETVTISGLVLNNAGIPISDADINLTGYADYSVQSAIDGTFVISNVFASNTYDLSIIKGGYLEYTANIEVALNDIVLPNIEMQSNPIQFELPIGNPETTTSSYFYPVNFNSKNSISQTIYMAQELNQNYYLADTNVISRITYNSILNGNIPANTPIKIWMANTESSSFASTSDWFPLDQMTLVFDSIIDMTSTGDYELVFLLQTPFVYTGDNIVVMIQRPFEESTYGTLNKFKYTATSNYPNRMMYKYATTEINLNDLGTGTRVSSVPNTIFTVNNGGYATLEGYVTYNELPLENVNVSIDGTPRQAITDAQGFYSIPYITPGAVNITASKMAFNDYHYSDIQLSANQTTIHSFTMTQSTTVTVNGTVMSSNGNTPVQNANVSIIGYQNYQTQTNNLGQFIVPDVFTGRTYTLNISKPGFQTYTSQITVLNENLTIPTITLNQNPALIEMLIGNANTTTSANNYPANFYFKNSLSQCIYMQSELNSQYQLAPGNPITSIKYYANLNGSIPADKPLKIWMANTSLTAFESTTGWIPEDQFTLVWDSTVDLSSTGEYELLINLDVPFSYNGENLVIMVQRPMDTAYYSSLNVWKNTATPAYPNRTIYRQSDTVVLDPAEPGTGVLASNVPNTFITLNTAGFGMLSGTITNNDIPLAGVRVAVDGTPRYAITNDQGVYEINYLFPGTINLTVSKHGFITQNITNVVMVAEQTTTQNIALVQLPTVIVTGQVNASDTSAGLNNALVRLRGYENYETQTDDTGAFSFPAVYSSQTYALIISRSGYQTDSTNVTIATTNMMIPTIVLSEIAYPASNVLAVDNGNTATITWDIPDPDPAPASRREKSINQSLSVQSLQQKTKSTQTFGALNQNIEKPVSQLPEHRALIGYNLFLTPVESMDDPDFWTNIANNVTTTQFDYEGWAQINSGQYKFVVQALYTGNVLSEPAFSNTLAKDMNASVAINLACADGQSPVGAVITLTNIDNDPEHIYTAVATGNVTIIQNVWLGAYQLTVTKTGYNPHSESGINIDNISYNHPLITLQVSNIYFEEGFEGDVFPPASWTLSTLDADQYNWQAWDEEDSAHEGLKCAASASYINNVGALFPDNWLITPPLVLAAESQYELTYWIAPQDPAYIAENYSVMISTSDTQLSNFTSIFSETLSESDFAQRTVSLNGYSGQTIYLAFRHHNCTDIYWIKLDDVKITRSLVNNPENPIIVKKTQLKGNYPNPFNPETSIAFDLENEAIVSIEIFNAKGQKVKTLINDRFTAGAHNIVWNGKDDHGNNVSSGIYFFNMKSGKYTSTRKMILMK